MKIYPLFLLFCLILMASCVGQFPVPKKVQESINCTNYSYTGLDTLINIHGYYLRKVLVDMGDIFKVVDGQKVYIGVDTSTVEFMFFNDGVYISDMGYYGMTVDQYLSYMTKNNLDFNRRVHYQGYYKLKGDTIKIQYVNEGAGNVWAAYEVWYKIIGKDRLELIHDKNLREGTIYDIPAVYEDRLAHFIYVDSIPESSSWLKHEEWMRCD